MDNMILEMIELQDKLNSNTSWNTWTSGLTNAWKIINWKRCCYMELAEAIDSLPWKHWKNIKWEVDYENFKIEIIDIFHFVLSEWLVHLSKSELLEKIKLYKNTKSSTKLPKFFDETNNLDLDKVLLPYENFMEICLKKSDLENFIDDFLKLFFECLDSSWITFEELYNLYIWKNVLNKFRQDNWYKEWTYIKVWNGSEDNVWMQKVLKTTTWFENIYLELEKIYKKL